VSDQACSRGIALDPVKSQHRAAKRFLDVAIAVSALLILAPVMVAIYLAIKMSDRGPALFKQERIGLGGQTFGCFKFRSMVLNADEALLQHLASNAEARLEWERDHKLTDDPRVTQIGRFLRKTSLDELPQLLNVLVGDMSVVGPRPIVRAEMVRYGEKFRHYRSVRPGLTGLWQISGRSDCSYPERVALDARYVEEWSLKTDVAILLKTVPAVLKQQGSY